MPKPRKTENDGDVQHKWPLHCQVELTPPELSGFGRLYTLNAPGPGQSMEIRNPHKYFEDVFERHSPSGFMAFVVLLSCLWSVWVPACHACERCRDQDLLRAVSIDNIRQWLVD